MQLAVAVGHPEGSHYLNEVDQLLDYRLHQNFLLHG